MEAPRIRVADNNFGHDRSNRAKIVALAPVVATLWAAVCDAYEPARESVQVRDYAVDQALLMLKDWIPANRRFHDGLARASGNRRFAEIPSDFNGLFGRFTYISASRMAEPRDFAGLVSEHKAVVEAITRRDRRAAGKLMRRHIEASRKSTKAAFGIPMFVA